MERQYFHQWSDDHTLLAAQHVATDVQHVLLLAREGATADTLMAILGEAGYAVDHVQSLDASVQALATATEAPVVIIIDHGATNNAFQATVDALRAAAPQPIRVLVIDDGARDDKRALEEGGVADGYLGLPLHGPEVVHHIDAQVRAAQDVQALEASRMTLLGTALLSIELTQSLRAELDAQRMLHHELLHRVQTHVGALRDYLELEVRRLPLGIAREAMRGVLYRVRSLSSMYETMAILGTEETIEFSLLATKISQGVKAMYSPRTKLPVVVEGQLVLSSTSASPLTLVINELVTNAYRHAFPGGRFGTIRIVCGRDEESGWCVVSDDGVGMELPAKTRPNSGMELIQQLVRRSLGGRCSWESHGRGTVAKVQFPLATP